MKNLKENDLVYIESYKHDGSVHRVWAKGLIIENNDKETVVVTDQTCVIESDGRRWLTKEPAVCFFYEDKWFNVISMARKNGIYYYVNLATPSTYDGEAIKNIDYDLDVKVFPDYSYMILDEYEYKIHSEQMQYPDSIKEIMDKQMKELLGMIEKREKPFNHETIEEYLMKYFKIISFKGDE